MAKRLMDLLLVIDVEATCWDGPVPEGQRNEIIEIGIATIDIATGERVDRHGVLVRPTHSTVGAFCTELTTLTQADVDGGVSFADACALLRAEYRSHQRVWASWGEYDRQQFERQCAAEGVPYPFGTRHLNAKSLYSLARGLDRELGMAGALDHAGVPLEGTHHRGVDDAWNIAALLAGVLRAARSDPPGTGPVTSLPPVIP
ncbi:exonuclease domain-containing protein [Embleya sp. NBC_00896]|uniref:exonuclease domain-containing protein n=1 Tax=Embleya sp. NBC_00896 TaxID=2975961 RepID=UPI00386C5F0D|nr:exonuclease domain-containing protein [Embleya sp. NBC_00896]